MQVRCGRDGREIVRDARCERDSERVSESCFYFGFNLCETEVFCFNSEWAVV